MASLNRKPTQETTHEGGPASRISKKAQLERSVMSCLLWENTFYENGVDIATRIVELVAEVPAADVAEIAIRAKQDMGLRHVPLLLASELAKTKDGRAELKNVLPSVITRADDINEFMAIYWRNGKCPVAKQIKKHLGEAYRKFDEYQLQKYNGGSKAVKLRDPLRLFHTKPVNDEQSALWGKLIKSELATPDTWEVAISAAKNPEEKTAAWGRLLSEGKLGGLALLRNLRNMREAGIDAKLIKAAILKLNATKLLPINFIAAASHNPEFETEIESKFLECFANKEKVGGKTAILVDVSSSMGSPVSAKSKMSRYDAATGIAMIGRELFADVEIYSFSGNLLRIPNRQGFALRDAILQSQGCSGTYLRRSLEQLPTGYDRVIVITDEQSHDGVGKPRAGQSYLLNVASYKNGVGYKEWTHIDGWSDKVINYILKYEQQSIEGKEND